eukprot:Nk52_evm113s352 gene=Nk52_evmTU113s352
MTEYNPGEELVMLVDRHNNVVGRAKRKAVRDDNMRHRCTFIIVKNPRTGLLVVQKRTMIKDYCPGYYDATTGGVMQVGEDYQESAQRELNEELGIADVSLEHLFTFLYEDNLTKVWGGVFLCLWDGDISTLNLQPEEVESVTEMSAEDILERAEKGETFTPDSTAAIKKYLEYCKNPKPFSK